MNVNFTMWEAILLLILFFFPLQYATAFSTENKNDIIHDQLKALVLKIQKQYHVNAISLAVIVPGSAQPILVNEGTTKIGSKEKISHNNLFQIGSITKTFTANLIATLFLDHQLSSSDTVVKFLPKYKKWADITVLDLLNQTSGIPDYTQSKNWWGNLVSHPKKIWTADELVEIAYHMPKKFKSNTQWAYSNTNYVLLGMILSKIEKKPVHELMQTLFNTAELSSTYYLIENYPENIKNKMVHGYHQQYDQTQLNPSWLQADGAIISSPLQLSQWYKKLFDPTAQTQFPLMRFTHFVNIKTAKPTENNANSVYSFGLFRMNTPESIIYFTPGLTPGYTSMVVYVPCLNIFFSYAASQGFMLGFHKDMLMGIMKILNQSLKSNTKNLPNYCYSIHHSKQFIFPNMK